MFPLSLSFPPASCYSRNREKNLIPEKRLRDSTPLVDTADDIYKSNIQIAELNALNAALAVIRYKQLRGFYADDENIYHLLLSISDLSIVGDKLNEI